MAKSRSKLAVDGQIAAILEETGKQDPCEAVRVKARALVSQYCDMSRDICGQEPAIPLELSVLVSMCGVKMSNDPPVHSRDEELVPEADGRVTMRINRDRPVTRQRFSIGHGISHTFFPDYDQKVQCRPDPRHRDLSDPEDVIEMLCDIGASELLFPMPWFAEDASKVNSASAVVALADKYQASREATIRRFVEISPSSVAAAFLIWKLKPRQRRNIRSDQLNFLCSDPIEEAKALAKLRVEYAVASPAFTESGHYLPKDKSVESRGVIYEASTSRCCVDAEEDLNLGPCRGRFRVFAIPVFTEEEDVGPNGEGAVVTVIHAIETAPRRKKPEQESQVKGFFD